MGGGSLNLTSANGTGDDILSLHPQITFFKKVYKRHTNFGLETKQINATSINTNSTESSLMFNSKLNYKIPRSSSLIHDMHIEFTLPPAIHSSGMVDGNPEQPILDGTGPPASRKYADGAAIGWENYCQWVNAVGYSIIDYIQLSIDNNVIDKHTGVWLDIWNELTDPFKKEWQLVGKKDDNTIIAGSVKKHKSRYYIPLKFFFNRNPGLALPIFLLNDNSVQIDISLKTLNSLLQYEIITPGSDILLDADNTNTNPGADAFSFNSDCKITDFKFYTTFIFLDKAEENRIKNNLPNEYLIETLNINETVNPNNNITLNNPVKELIWVIRKSSRLLEPSANGMVDGTTISPNINDVLLAPTNTNDYPNDIFNYSLQTENLLLGYGTYDTFKTLQINISNQNRIDVTDSTHFRTIQPYKHHSNVPGGISNELKKYIYVYSFALNPEEYQPSGSFNFSKDNDTLKLNFTELGNITETSAANDITNYRLDLFSIHYKYLSITNGSIDLNDVPFSKEIPLNPELLGTLTKCKDRKDELEEAEINRKIAIENEVKRRYDIKQPDVHKHINFKKKKWSGFQGTFDENEKKN